MLKWLARFVGLWAGTYVTLQIYMNYKSVKMIYGGLATKYGKIFSVDSNYILAVIFQESGGNFLAVAATPDVGAMQLTQPALDDWNSRHNESVTLLEVYFNPYKNIEIGSWYLGWLIKELKDIKLALSAYNQGIGNVRRKTFTLDYYEKVQIHYNQLIKI